MIDEDIQRARKILEIADIIDVYYYYLIRRGVGSFYIGISASVSVALLLMLNFISEALPTYWILFGYIILWLFIFGIIFILSKQLFTIPSIYMTRKKGDRETKKRTSIYLFIMLSTIYVIMFLHSIVDILPSYFAPLSTEIYIGCIQVWNYWQSYKTSEYPGKVSKEYLIFGVILFLGSLLIPLYPEYGWFIVLIFGLIGTYLFGLYLIISASSILVKGKSTWIQKP